MASTRIDWVAEDCRLLRSISAEFKDTLPFRGLTIGIGIHLEAKTVALILTLRDGGARLVIAARPDLILDNGGDLLATYLDAALRRPARGNGGDNLRPDAPGTAP